jgi:hypothetical protein
VLSLEKQEQGQKTMIKSCSRSMLSVTPLWLAMSYPCTAQHKTESQGLYLATVKSKAIRVQNWTGPEGSGG